MAKRIRRERPEITDRRHEPEMTIAHVTYKTGDPIKISDEKPMQFLCMVVHNDGREYIKAMECGNKQFRFFRKDRVILPRKPKVKKVRQKKERNI